ncbi:MAG TPA: transporter, partial [Clostridiales bacterium]|nr:transporter [Clostridiales bacterium]
MKDVSIGRYVQGNSVLHKLDPRCKFLLFILYMVTIFLVNSTITMVATLGVILFLTLLSQVNPVEILKSLKPILFIMIFIFVINLLTIRSGDTLWSWWIIKITTGGLKKAIFMAVRLIFLIVATSILLSLTTTPLKLADAMESLGSPLKVIKVPVSEISMTISIALRFIPTLVEETD